MELEYWSEVSEEPPIYGADVEVTDLNDFRLPKIYSMLDTSEEKYSGLLC